MNLIKHNIGKTDRVIRVIPGVLLTGNPFCAIQRPIGLNRPLASIAFVALLLASGGAFADADGPDFFAVTGVAADDVLNIRTKPSPTATKIGEIPPDGTCVRNLGCRGGLTFQEFTEFSPAQQAERQRENPRWCKVEYDGVTGWVAGRYLREGHCDPAPR
jgi:hypothetical protein